MKEITMELLVMTGYGTSRLVIVNGGEKDVNKKINELKNQFLSIGIVKLTEEIIKEYPTVADRWSIDEIERYTV